MSETYQFFAHLAQTWGLIYFFVMFIAVLVYALWPVAAERLRRTARMPLRED